jgi:diguanylate cyclase (GGDEF)-like protein
MQTIEVDFLGIIDSSGRTVRVVSVDATGSEPGLPAAVEGLLASRPTVGGRGAVGILSTPRGPLMASVQPIMRSDGSGPSAGTLVMGRYLGAEDAMQLSRITGELVSLLETRAADAALSSVPAWSDPRARVSGVVVPQRGEKVSGYRLIIGLDDRPSLVLSVVRPSTTVILVRETGGYLLFAVVVASLALVVGVIGAIDSIVTQRLKCLSEDVRSITRDGDFSRRVEASGSDEISALGSDINTMLTTLNSSQLELEYMAGHDMLTTLFNRRRFEEELERDLMEQTRTQGRGAILWLDIDDFKEVNDTLGHAVGDRLLAEFSSAIKRETRSYATLARIGGDEFALILPNADLAEAEMAAERLINLLRTHVFEIDEHRITQRVSVGIALYPDHGSTTDELLVCADLAMYEAKNSGGDAYRVFDCGDDALQAARHHRV